MNKKNWIQIHLMIAAFTLPFLLMMPVSGTMYLLGFKGEAERSLVFTSAGTPSGNLKIFFENELKQKGLDFEFEYVKESGNTFILRPSHKEHFEVVKTSEGLEFYKLRPNFLKSIIELHKGHGPGLFKRLETLFGMLLIMLTISGLFLIYYTKAYYRLSVLSFALGGAAILLALYL